MLTRTEHQEIYTSLCLCFARRTALLLKTLLASCNSFFSFRQYFGYVMLLLTYSYVQVPKKAGWDIASSLLSPLCYNESTAMILPLLLLQVLLSIIFVFFFLSIRNCNTSVCSMCLHFLHFNEKTSTLLLLLIRSPWSFPRDSQPKHKGPKKKGRNDVPLFAFMNRELR